LLTPFFHLFELLVICILSDYEFYQIIDVVYEKGKLGENSEARIKEPNSKDQKKMKVPKSCWLLVVGC